MSVNLISTVSFLKKVLPLPDRRIMDINKKDDDKPSQKSEDEPDVPQHHIPDDQPSSYKKGPFFMQSSVTVLNDPELSPHPEVKVLMPPSDADPLHEKSKQGFTSAFRRASLRLVNIMRSFKPGNRTVERQESVEDVGLTFEMLDKAAMQKLEVDKEDVEVSRELSDVMDHYRGEYQEKLKSHHHLAREFTYTEMVKTLQEQGIPFASDEDYVKLEGNYVRKWDPDGTVVEYYSPVLRSFIPINMRGRYRGCWQEDVCVQGLDISKILPKPDALEGARDRTRKQKTEQKYQSMFDVAQDEAHLDYLIEMEKAQKEMLPIPIMYDVLNFGVDVLKRNLETIILDEVIPPTSRIYKTTENQTLNIRKKLQVYAALGLEPLHGEHKGLGDLEPMWKFTKDQLIQNILERRHKPDEYEEMLKGVKKVYADMGLETEEPDLTQEPFENDLDPDYKKAKNLEVLKTKGIKAATSDAKTKAKGVGKGTVGDELPTSGRNYGKYGTKTKSGTSAGKKTSKSKKQMEHEPMPDFDLL